MSKLTECQFSASDNRHTENQKEQKNNNKKDKIDKTPDETGEEIKHNIFTKELIKRNYISKDDSSSFLFDQLFSSFVNLSLI